VSGVFQTTDLPPPLHPAGVSSPRTKGGVHTRRAVRGVNILEDARHWIGLLQFNPSTIVVIGWTWSLDSFLCDYFSMVVTNQTYELSCPVPGNSICLARIL